MATKNVMTALLALVLVAFTGSVVAEDKSNVIVLTADNFEHLTQAATGATTGDWLVKFYAPWCGHCKRLAPVFEDVANELKGSVNVAKVDVTENSELGKRFDVRGYPTVFLFHQGKMYKYSGQRTAAELVRFATGGYENLVGSKVPAPPTVWTAVAHHTQLIKEDFVALMATKKNVLLVTFSGGLLLGLLLGCLCNCCTSRSAPKKTKTA
ncbi:TPA: hypothetical protein N0F65_000625 [Lagenidium giganteum]|uniref:Thioredoxin domain-containing protein n=1 Tax=Lagenidium giganteum TaxID=4803 RepID=A0AAV2YNT8_9STRA|nr:TPA: hypothetical protein N0F65_000625 [Lagenidium giganteum]